ASPCDDGSAVFANPAALAGSRSTNGFGTAAVQASGSFRFDDRRPPVPPDRGTTWAPFGSLHYSIRPNLSAAIGASSPYAASSAWPTDFEGRFLSRESRLSSVYVRPTLAYSPVPGFSLGGGTDIVFTHLQYA